MYWHNSKCNYAIKIMINLHPKIYDIQFLGIIAGLETFSEPKVKKYNLSCIRKFMSDEDP